MTTMQALLVGVLIGVSGMMAWVLSILVRFVATDLDGFRKWLDVAGAP